MGPASGIGRAPELEPEGEASLGPADSQAQAPGGTAGWRKEVPVPGPGGGPARAPEPKLTGEASLSPVDSQAWAPREGLACGPEWTSPLAYIFFGDKMKVLHVRRTRTPDVRAMRDSGKERENTQRRSLRGSSRKLEVSPLEEEDNAIQEPKGH
ncbi:hypothetical protein NDU88_007509 [Pleurodeles waltl]|uniref:Uncharacterized protein n=1 Tax=Pleurodeles waltl TaxID=8319 RepID=A0AAV7N4G7_PLEWA|nr:hypothetical protein NDU88_007509 [Pleurodeles waltl]